MAMTTQVGLFLIKGSPGKSRIRVTRRLRQIYSEVELLESPAARKPLKASQALQQRPGSPWIQRFRVLLGCPGTEGPGRCSRCRHGRQGWHQQRGDLWPDRRGTPEQRQKPLTLKRFLNTSASFKTRLNILRLPRSALLIEGGPL